MKTALKWILGVIFIGSLMMVDSENICYMVISVASLFALIPLVLEKNKTKYYR